MRSGSDEYDRYAPLLAQYAAMAPTDRRRVGVRDELVCAFLPVAHHIAHRFARRGEPVDDLEQVASIGLLNAVDRFDPTKGHEFLSYAVPTITGEVRRHFRDATWTVRTPRSIKDRHLAVGSAITDLSHALGRSPTVDETARHLELTHDEVIEAMTAHHSRHPESLDRTLSIDDEHSGRSEALVDLLIAEDPHLDRAEQRALLQSLLGHLPRRERHMLALRFIHQRTQREIGTELAISQMHVSRLLKQTLDLLRSWLTDADHQNLHDHASEPTCPATVAGQTC